jgi:dUTP pyrophosphatase
MKTMLDEGAFAPERKHPTDAGLDLKTPIDVFIRPKDRAFVDTGIHIELPANTVGMVKSRSGLNKNYGVQCEGVIDENYRGSIGVVLYNHSDKPVTFNKGDRIGQLVILPCIYEDVELVDKLGNTDRGEGGFGSTGAN